MVVLVLTGRRRCRLAAGGMMHLDVILIRDKDGAGVLDSAGLEEFVIHETGSKDVGTRTSIVHPVEGSDGLDVSDTLSPP